MAKKKEETKKYDNPNVVGLHAAIVEQPITETLETNYMPYNENFTKVYCV